MRVVFADHVTDNTRRLDRLGAGHQPEFAHGEEHPALQAVKGEMKGIIETVAK